MDEKAIRRAGYKRGMEDGMEAGKTLGEKNEKIKMAKRLKEMGMEVEKILEVTELSEEEIEEI